MEHNQSEDSTGLQDSQMNFSVTENSSLIEDEHIANDPIKDIPYNFYELTINEIYKNHRGLIITTQVIIVLLYLLKYFYPKGFRNTQHKLIAFMYLVSAFQIFQSILPGPIFGRKGVKYYLLLVTVFQISLHLFKISSFTRKRVVSNQEQISANYDRVYELKQNPFRNNFKMSIIESILDNQTGFENKNFMIPIDVAYLNLFVIVFQFGTEYIGITDYDYWQYMILRLTPYLSIALQVFLIDGLKSIIKQSDPSIDYTFGVIYIMFLLCSLIYDLENSNDSTLSDYFDEQFQDDIKMKNANKLTIEKTDKTLKMIIYRVNQDGGIQGILLDFFIDDDGNIANEFYIIDQDGNLVKIEKGIKPLEDKQQIQNVFKQFFLKN
ncbi:UNKNOWN [Stylonychia lemnae]|uniref:Transmembrane protein n=1 Tax=Stylonychia lemnae TaxID=5949 RepID=A0A078A295_STYLE|nr:UNKNOWN [Stylonychia lemnae]|eukprot:CDW75628.1 UNKNOWN [Stylonychia lemnae]